jgi:RraA family protein
MTPNKDAQRWPTGFSINERRSLPPSELIEAFRSVPTAHVSDNLGRNIGTIGLRSYHRSLTLTMCGPALTIRTRPGDNLMIHMAIIIAQPGDVLVIDGGANISQALVGGLMRTLAIARKIGGFVVNGAVRDVAEWAEGVMPVYALAHTHRGPSKDGPGEINVPVNCAGLVVTPGDLVLGDADGVVAISAETLPGLLPLVREQAQKEAGIRDSNAKGILDIERFNALLRTKGCPL